MISSEKGISAGDITTSTSADETLISMSHYQLVHIFGH